MMEIYKEFPILETKHLEGDSWLYTFWFYDVFIESVLCPGDPEKVSQTIKDYLSKQAHEKYKRLLNSRGR